MFRRKLFLKYRISVKLEESIDKHTYLGINSPSSKLHMKKVHVLVDNSFTK